MVYGNCKFYKQHETGEGLKWRCVKRNCLAKIYTDGNATVIINTYISEDAKFPPIIWASNTMDGERTTNACESFHAKFNANFSSKKDKTYA